MGIYEVIGVCYVVFTSTLGSVLVLAGFARASANAYRMIVTGEREEAKLSSGQRISVAEAAR
jgi:hypothetical protein